MRESLQGKVGEVRVLTRGAEGAEVRVACRAEVRGDAISFGGEQVSQRLLLAKDQGWSGELAPAEVEGLALAAGATVVLSCCQSGLGEVSGEGEGEGVIALSRSSFAAGAGAQVVALCHIPDHKTSLLMAALYRHHVGHGQSLGAAMQLAVLERARLEPHPRHPPATSSPTHHWPTISWLARPDASVLSLSQPLAHSIIHSLAHLLLDRPDCCTTALSIQHHTGLT